MTAVTTVNLGSYTISKHIRDLERDYDVLSIQKDGGYFVNAPDGKVIKVGTDGKGKENDATPGFLFDGDGEDPGSSAKPPNPEKGTRGYTLGNTAWTIDANKKQIERHAAKEYEGYDNIYKSENVLKNTEVEKLDLIWLSPLRIVGYGDYRVEKCTTETECLKKGVQIFELGGDDKIAHQKIPIKDGSYRLGEGKAIGGFGLLEDGSKCFWLWNATGELNFVKEDQLEKNWKKWKYTLTFSNTGTDIIEFDFDIAISPITGGLLPPKYIVVIAKGEDGKLGLYTATPD